MINPENISIFPAETIAADLEVYILYEELPEDTSVDDLDYYGREILDCIMEDSVYVESLDKVDLCIKHPEMQDTGRFEHQATYVMDDATIADVAVMDFGDPDDPEDHQYSVQVAFRGKERVVTR